MITRLLKIISYAFPLCLAAGCATNYPEQSTSYSTHNKPKPPVCEFSLATAGSNCENPLLVQIPGGPCAEDRAIGEAIREMLMADRKLAPAPSNVITVVSNGVVTMKGYVRSRQAALELHQRIAGLPGVQSVQDELTLWNGHKI
jgi:hypothetical protein